MPAPKTQGEKPISEGIKYNRKHGFYVVYQNFNKANVVDRKQFFPSQEEAEEALKNLHSENG